MMDLQLQIGGLSATEDEKRQLFERHLLNRHAMLLVGLGSGPGVPPEEDENTPEPSAHEDDMEDGEKGTAESEETDGEFPNSYGVCSEDEAQILQSTRPTQSDREFP